MTLTGNAATILAARIITALANLALAVLVAARIGSAGFGTFAALIGGAAVANLLVTFGVDLVVVRAVADRRPDAATTVRRAVALQLVGAGAGIAGAGVLVLSGLASPLVLLAAISLVPLGITTVAAAVIRGVQHMGDILVGAVVSSVLTITVAVAIVDQGPGRAVLAVLIGHVVNAAVLATRARSHLVATGSVAAGSIATASIATASTARSPIPGGLPTLLSESWVFATATVASAVMTQGALIVFEVMGSGDAGGLAAGLRLAETARMVPAAAFAALFPAMFDGVHHSVAYRRLFAGIVIYAVAAVGAVVGLAPWLARLLFDDPPQGALIIRVVAFGLLATVFRLRYSFELMAAGRERAVMVIAVVTTAAACVGYVLGARTDRPVFVAAVLVAAITVNALFLGFEATGRTGRPTV